MIKIRTQTKTYFVKEENILYCKANGRYTIIKLSDIEITYAKNLLEVESKLSNKNFFRIHNSHTVNVEFIKEYSHRTFEVILTDNTKLKISKRKLSNFNKFITKN
ncbi:MAG TPA: hypothetical protein DEH02_03645 [Bacteroidales bacterium]|nr:hypothetical protein [Bacteroidales bacterium]